MGRRERGEDQRGEKIPYAEQAGAQENGLVVEGRLQLVFGFMYIRGWFPSLCINKRGRRRNKTYIEC